MYDINDKLIFEYDILKDSDRHGVILKNDKESNVIENLNIEDKDSDLSYKWSLITWNNGSQEFECTSLDSVSDMEVVGNAIEDKDILCAALKQAVESEINELINNKGDNIDRKHKAKK